MFEPLIWWVFCMFAWVAISWHVYMSIGNCYIACKVSTSKLQNSMSIWWEITWSCGDMKGGKMVLLKHASLMPNHLTPMLTWIKSHYRSSPFCVLPHVFCKEYGLVGCKPLSLYTPNRGVVMRVPWPWIKAIHPVRGHGCFRLGPRGGHPLERAI